MKSQQRRNGMMVRSLTVLGVGGLLLGWIGVADAQTSASYQISRWVISAGGGRSTGEPHDAIGAALQEDFDDGIADDFAEVGGTWAVVGGEYVQSTEDPPGPYRSWVNAGDLQEYTIEVDCSLLSGYATKVIYAHADTYEWYRLDLWLDRTRITMPPRGDPSQPRQVTVWGLDLSYGQTCHIKIEVSLAGVKVWLDGVLRHDHAWANDEPLGDGQVGLGTYAATSSFDNFMVSAPARYDLTGTLGQPSPVGVSKSASYILASGFWGGTGRMLTVAIEGISYGVAEGVRITWQSVAGATYTIYYTDALSLSTVWNSATTTTGTGGLMQWLDNGAKTGTHPGHPSVEKRFYRLRGQP